MSGWVVSDVRFESVVCSFFWSNRYGHHIAAKCRLVRSVLLLWCCCCFGSFGLSLVVLFGHLLGWLLSVCCAPVMLPTVSAGKSGNMYARCVGSKGSSHYRILRCRHGKSSHAIRACLSTWTRWLSWRHLEALWCWLFWLIGTSFSAIVKWKKVFFITGNGFFVSFGSGLRMGCAWGLSHGLMATFSGLGCPCFGSVEGLRQI